MSVGEFFGVFRGLVVWFGVVWVGCMGGGFGVFWGYHGGVGVVLEFFVGGV